MPSFSQLFGAASRAVQKMTSSTDGASASSGGRDWRTVVRSAAEAVTREPGTTPTPPRTGAASGGPAPAPMRSAPSAYAPPTAAPAPVAADDRAAIARYDYLLRTADPDQVERMHREAFERLTPTQRDHVRARMQTDLPPHEHPRSDSAADLARTAARAEAARPGRLPALLGRAGLVGTGAAAAGGLLVAVAGGAVLSSVGAPLLAHAADLGVDVLGQASSLDVEALASGVDVGAVADATGVGEWATGVESAASGVGDHVTGIGEGLSGLDVPGWGDLFGR